ncbi:MAG: fasciclin domain-containing protein [Planctomycetota bacterium]|nr:fasciclin domain-containing protein [Planctomycetota bacterium]
MARMGIHEILCMADFPRAKPRTQSGRFRGNILQLLHEKSFHLLLRGLEAAGLCDRLAASGPYTLLAPTDAAFRHPQADGLLRDPARLRGALSRHIVWGHLDLETIFEMGLIAPIHGPAIPADRTNARLGGAKVVHPDIEAPNGIIHGIADLL